MQVSLSTMRRSVPSPLVGEDQGEGAIDSICAVQPPILTPSTSSGQASPARGKEPTNGE